MHPVLFEIFGITIYSYGAMIFIAFLVSLFFAKKLAKIEGISTKLYEDIAIMGLIVGLLGAKLLYFFVNLNTIFSPNVSFIEHLRSGFVFYGAPIAVVIYLYYAQKKFKFSCIDFLDITMAVIPIGHAIGRIGCLLAGCCYGRPTNLPWGVKLNSDVVPENLIGVTLHPVQIYESILLVFLFIFLYKKFKNKSFKGQIFSLYCILYAPIRFFCEFFRGDDVRGYVPFIHLSTSQFISVLFLVVGLLSYNIFKKNKGK